MSYKNLKIWSKAKNISIEIHNLTLNELPSFEKYETASQIRRSSKSTRSNIVEGYGRRRYQKEYIRFLIFAYASNLETQDHLETLYETKSLKNGILYKRLLNDLNELGKMLNRFIIAIESRNY